MAYPIYGTPGILPSQGQGMGMGGGLEGLLSGGNPLFNMGLGILANNYGNYGNAGVALGRGGLQGMQQTQQFRQLQNQNAIAQLQLQEAMRKAEQAKKRDAALPRLLVGNEAYTSMQETPVTTSQNMPIPAAEGAQAPNFGLQRQDVTTMQQSPVFDEKQYIQDLIDSGYGDDLVKMKLAPKKVGYRDVGGQLIPYDEATGMPRADLKPIDKSLTPDAQANLMMENFKFNNLSASQRASNELTARGQNITIRGQNMTDARAKEANANQGKAPAGYRWSEDGMSMIPIKGGPADKQSTVSEGERKSATLLKRMEGSLGQLQSVLETAPGAAKPELIPAAIRGVTFGMAEAAPNFVTSSNRQQVEAAQLDILDAALTLGTGAAYTKEQLEGYRKSYFPQIGDSNATVQAKQRRLENVLDAARIAAGRAAPAQSGASGGWSIQEVK